MYREALQALHNVADEITITDLRTDELEEQFMSRFATTGYVKSVRTSCAELSHSELDIVIFGQLMGCVNDSSSVSVVARHQ